MRFLLSAATMVAAVAIPTQAFAYDWSAVGKVTFIEATYAPNVLPFRIDGGGGSCPAGSTLMWNPQGADANAKAASYATIMSVILTAKSTGQYINVFGDNAGCNIDFIYIIT